MVDPLSYFSFQLVLTTGVTNRGMCYHICGMMHIQDHARASNISVPNCVIN